MRLEIPPDDFAGYIFDLDGTLADTMPLHYLAWDEALRQFGLKERLSEDLFYSFGGVPTVRVGELFGYHYGMKFDPVQLMHVKEQLYLKLVPQVKPIEPVANFLRTVASKKPRAIATGGLPEIALPTLRGVGLDSYFNIIVTPQDVPPGRGKPEPDMYLLAAEKMGVPANQCLVFEDAEPGVQAALAAGMKVVHVPSRKP